jgi:hypothetical protein
MSDSHFHPLARKGVVKQTTHEQPRTLRNVEIYRKEGVMENLCRLFAVSLEGNRRRYNAQGTISRLLKRAIIHMTTALYYDREKYKRQHY